MSFKFAALIFLNIMLTPLYFSVFVFLFLLTFVPIFPSRVAVTNIRQRLGYGFISSHNLAASVFFHYFLYGIEVFLIWPLGLTQTENSHEMADFLERMIKKYDVSENQRGFTMLAPHLGTIETAGQEFGKIHRQVVRHDIVALAQPSGSKILTSIINWYRKKREITTVLTGSKELNTKLAQIAASNESIVLLIDQKPRRGGVFIDFFGKEAAFPYRGLSIMVQHKVPVLYASMVRIFPGYFRHLFSDAPNVHLAGHEQNASIGQNVIHFIPEDVENATAQILAGFAAWSEKEIRKYPSQWCWDYRKWSRKLPNNES